MRSYSQHEQQDAHTHNDSRERHKQRGTIHIEYGKFSVTKFRECIRQTLFASIIT